MQFPRHPFRALLRGIAICTPRVALPALLRPRPHLHTRRTPLRRRPTPYHAAHRPRVHRTPSPYPTSPTAPPPSPASRRAINGWKRASAAVRGRLGGPVLPCSFEFVRPGTDRRWAGPAARPATLGRVYGGESGARTLGGVYDAESDVHTLESGWSVL
ncbi:hypothetical protein K488DRAFT_88001 [Vararia minispora EC-137]|uniref:Uncharacterized protein n=1 Tax=Vararia minispora EC-137 TaxID=1314806 RepID=A0ACB8QFV5_9AGAM|nr:hypothetical protein K488DRAFT_88001 [Vararia minispora EC-137]